MKFFLITDYFWPSMGGLENSTAYLAECLQQQVDVEVLTATENRGKELNKGFKIKRFPSYGKDIYKAMFKYLEQEEDRFGVGFMGFSQHWTTELLNFVQQLKKRLNCSIFFKIPSMDSFSNFIQNERQLNQFLAIDYIICLNAKIKEELLSRGIPKDKLVARTNGIPTHRFVPARREAKRLLRQQFGIDKRLTFIFTGRFSFVKRVDLLVEAFSLLTTANLVLVGEFDKRFAKGYSFTIPEESNNIHVFRPTSNIVPFLQAADVYVSASRSEGMSNSLLEAMSCGLPALVSDIEGHRLPIAPEKNGSFFQSENLDALLQGIRWFIDHRRQYSSLSNNARQTIIKDYSIAQVAEKYLNLMNHKQHQLIAKY